MLNYVWMFMLVAGFLISILNGRLDQTVQAALSSSQSAVELSIGLMGIICLWSGLMNIAQKSGMIKIIARLTRPIFKILFPQIAKNDRAMGAVVMNLAANFLGLGNAATPLGIRAMSELQRVNTKKDTASDSMCMFLILNTSAIQLIPTTIIAIRSSAGSAAPSEITSCVWVASVCATIAGVVSAFFLSKASALSQ